MNPDALIKELSSIARGYGFNIIQTIKHSDYECLVQADRAASTIAPFARSITLLGFAGKGFWETLVCYIEENPGFRDLGSDLVDNYSKIVLNELSKLLESQGIEHKRIYPFGARAMALDFAKLGQAAGAGVPSQLGVLIHPEYGPWISLRGAIISELELEHYDKELKGFSPCSSCDKPCVDACPVKAVSVKGWDWETCMKFRLSEQTCSANCASRRVCPYGREYQYSEEQLSYHHGFVLRNARGYFKENPS